MATIPVQATERTCRHGHQLNDATLYIDRALMERVEAVA